MSLLDVVVDDPSKVPLEDGDQFLKVCCTCNPFL